MRGSEVAAMILRECDGLVSCILALYRRMSSSEPVAVVLLFMANASMAAPSSQYFYVGLDGEHIQDVATTGEFVAALCRAKPKDWLSLSVVRTSSPGVVRRVRLWPHSGYQARVLVDHDVVWVHDYHALRVACIDLGAMRVVKRWEGWRPSAVMVAGRLVLIVERERVVGVHCDTGQVAWTTTAWPAGKVLLAAKACLVWPQQRLLMPLLDLAEQAYSIASIDIETGQWSDEHVLGPQPVLRTAACGALAAVVQAGLVSWFAADGPEVVAEVPYDSPSARARLAPTWSNRNATAWDGSHLYFAQREPPVLFSIDANTMAVAWTASLPGTPSTTYFAMTPDAIVVGCAYNDLLAKPSLELLWYRRESGKLLGSHPVVLSDDLDWGGQLMVVAGESIVAVEGGTVLRKLEMPR